MTQSTERDPVHDLVLPTLLFAAIGGMAWAVRGCTGFGGSAGCIFAGVMWGTAWWYVSRTPEGEPARRYTSGWIVLALTLGIGLSGARGWMQWSSFFEGKLQTDYAKGEFVPISPTYGFIWLFIAGMPWAGVGACFLAWCGPLRETRAVHWTIRIACGIAGAIVAFWLFRNFPQYFMPLYESIEERYRNLDANPNLQRLIDDSRSAILHLGFYLGLLLYEVARRDWKNVVLIATVGVVNGLGWAALQNWKWAPRVWPNESANWWRCWESSGGISIGIAYGLAFWLVNPRMTADEWSAIRARRGIEGPTFDWLFVYLGLTVPLALFMWGETSGWGFALLAVVMAFGVVYTLLRRTTFAAQPPAPGRDGDPNLERFGLYLGLILGLGFSLRNGIKGWFNIYHGRDVGDLVSGALWQMFGPAMLAAILLACAWVIFRPLARDFRGDVFPRATGLMWLVLVWQNIVAQVVTGPTNNWHEFAFSIYYALLFAITAVIVVHYAWLARVIRAT